MAHLRRARLLVVEDSRVIRRIIASVFRGLGIGEVDVAADGRSALRMLRTQRYDIVFSDWEMEPMSGLELLTAMRNDPALRSVRFVMLTSNAGGDAVRAAYEAGADNYMVKPFDAATLHRKVDSLLRQAA